MTTLLSTFTYAEAPATAAPSELAPLEPHTPPPPIFNFRHTWTNEWLVVTPLALPRSPTLLPQLRRLQPAIPLRLWRHWLAQAWPLPPADQIAWFFRDHYTNRVTTLAPSVLELPMRAALAFGKSKIEIVSAFRSPKYNLMLRKKGRQVARDSEHTHGLAVDFRVPGVPLSKLHAWAKAQQRGGVGLYVKSGFIHMDTGPIRYWTGD